MIKNILRKKAPITKSNTYYNRKVLPKVSKSGPLRLDSVLFFLTIAFVLFGLIFTYSSSGMETSSYFQRQLIFDIIGLGVGLFLSQYYHRLRQIPFINPNVMIIITWILLIIVLFTRTQAHVHRWIDFGFFKLQPSEIAKVTLVIYNANYLSKVAGLISRDVKQMITLLWKPFAISGCTLLLILAEKDLGTPILMGSVFACMLIVAGMKFLHLILPAIPVGLFVLYQVLFVPYRRARVLSFLNPFAQEGDIGYQLVQSFLAVGSGGWFGKGFGNSELKMQYLPAAHTDFIFSIMCEEIGLFVGLVIAGFCLLLLQGVNLAQKAKNNDNALLIFGLTLTITLQAFFNMGMAIGLLPTKGIALPFFSYGGSSVIMTLAMMGIILNTAAVENQPQNGEEIPHFKRDNR